MSNERWRAFAELYVIARAPHFKEGQEREDGWEAILDAKTLYKKISGMYGEEEPIIGPGTQAYIGGPVGLTGATGSAAPWRRTP